MPIGQYVCVLIKGFRVRFSGLEVFINGLCLKLGTPNTTRATDKQLDIKVAAVNNKVGIKKSGRLARLYWVLYAIFNFNF